MATKKPAIEKETELPCDKIPCTSDKTSELVHHVAAPKKVRIVGNAMVLTSTIKFDTIQKLEKYNQNALCLTEVTRDEEVEIFRIGTGKVSSINKFGITFAEKSAQGFATATILLPENVTDKKTFVKENFANVLFMLNDVEALVVRACAEIDAAFDKLDADIEEM